MSINLLTLGGPAAGKSIYLASLYKQLSIQNDDPNLPYQFRIKTADRDSGRLLNSICAEIADTSADFPKGTRGFTNWNFDCQIKSPHGVYNVCQFNYVDYAGGIINQCLQNSGQEQNIEALNAAIEKAHIIFILLDGLEIFNLLHGRHQKNRLSDWLNNDIENIFIDIQDKDVPVYFAISKWDCLRPKHGSNLSEIREELLRLPNFNKFIKGLTSNKGRIIRLIPMSSLGNGFAEIVLGRDGIIQGMKKTGQPYIAPYNVEVPLVYALLDTLLISYQNAKKQEEAQLFIANLLANVAKIIGGVGCDFLPPPLNMLSKASLEVMIKALQDGQPVAKVYQDINLSNIKEQGHAIKHLLNCFWYVTKKFESEYPGSVLNHPTWHHSN